MSNPVTREKLLSKIEGEIKAGREWRAKEILRGSMQSVAADPVLLERYGQLLDALGDRLEAGKYYFLSGARAPAYESAIALFLQRYSRGGAKQILRQFPSAVRRVGFSQLTETTQRDLQRLGLKPTDFEPRPRVSAGQYNTGWVRSIPAFTLLAIILIGLVVGFLTVWEWGRRLF